MRAVNLIPADVRRSSSAATAAGRVPVYALLGVLGAALALVTFYVLTTNTIADRQAKLTTLRAEVAQAQAEAGQLDKYATFAQAAQARAETVRQIAATRFDWHGALADLARVVPANTSLQSLVGSVVPGASAGGGGASGVSSLRGNITAPAFELTGCTVSQDDVARLMSRLRLINGVTRVTLGMAQKTEGAQAGASVATTSNAGSASSSQGCKPSTPAFDLVVFFRPLPGAGSAGAAAPTPVQGATNPTATTAPATSTPAGTAPTTTAPITTPPNATGSPTNASPGGTK